MKTSPKLKRKRIFLASEKIFSLRIKKSPSIFRRLTFFREKKNVTKIEMMFEWISA
jgi:hypothetical protein